VYRFYGPLLFANVRFFIERLNHFIARQAHPVQEVIVDARAIPEIDITAAEQLRVYFQTLRERGIQIVVAKAHLPLRETALELGLQEAFSDDNYFPKLSEAVAAFERRRTSPSP
jgi:SulP family sulfate permease